MAPSSSNWFQKLLSPLLLNKAKPQEPGTTWSAGNAERAFSRGDLNSQTGGRKVRVAFRNQSKLTVVLSWVAENGKCHHFYHLKPAQVIEGPVTALDHVETTFVGHSFCIAHVGDHVKAEGQIDAKYVVGGYRPDSAKAGAADDDYDKTYAHLVTISQKPRKNFLCFAPPNLRGTDEVGNNFEDLCWCVEATESSVDDKQINTRDKVYEEAMLGGWPVRLEENWHGGNKDLEKRLTEDLERAAKILPAHARDFLRKNTPVFVNKTLQYGPQVCPIESRGCCFHPQKDWLEENFMNCDKCECVEIYCAREYLDDCEMWGRAGVLVHEFSHAYHHKCLSDGYDNKEIQECYDQAMKERLYDWVHVHGTQGPMAKHYACTNQMEYFAELSAAFLGQPDMHSPEEYNKWYPFNRRQIQEHDPRAYAMLKKVWKIED